MISSGMMNKRRRSSSVATISDESNEFATPEREISPEFHGMDISANTSTSGSILASSSSARKRKKLDPSELCQQLYDSIRNVKKDDGNMLCDAFIRAPKRRSLPEYYEVVSDPVDLLRIQQKLKTDTYQNLDDIMSDFELMVKNTKAFFNTSTQEYQDACSLWDLLCANKIRLESEISDACSINLSSEYVDSNNIKKGIVATTKSIGRPRKTTSAEDEDDEIDEYEELFASVLTAIDPTMDNRPLYLEFQLLPSKKLYPDYYSIIEKPIDLKIIATKIQNQDYETIDEMEEDLLLMVKNACLYNEPGSQIYEDAKALRRIFTTKKIDLKTGRAIKTQSKQRGQSLSALTAALQEEPESSDDEMDDIAGRQMEALMTRIFNQLNNHQNSKDEPLGTILWRLPHPRWEKEYYEKNPNPVSMSQIQSKIKKRLYPTYSALKADFERMCDNIISSIASDHRMHIAAVQLQSLIPQKFSCVIDTATTNMDESDTLDTDTSSILSSSNNAYKTDSKLNLKPPTKLLQSKTNSSSVNTTTTPKSKLNFHSALVKNKLLNLHKVMTDHLHEGRKLILNFLEKPSELLYPDYYEVIDSPVDMLTIETNIKNDKYVNIDEAIADYRKMFNNCRKYNEEGSRIYEDANILERVLNDKIKEFSLQDITPTKKIMTTTNGGNVVRRKLPTLANTQTEGKCRKIYESIRDYRESGSNRQLSSIFMRLPSKADYPDYYDIIKNPIDMEKIFTKIRQQQYSGVDDITNDFLMMFKNACTYNESDSQIFKDACKLQEVCLEIKKSINADEESVPDVQGVVQDMLQMLYTSLVRHEDDDGRSYSESLAEVPEYDVSIDGRKVRGINLEIIKRRLEKGLYKRLDIFQEDLFDCLERVRKYSASNSQAFDDSIQLQLFYIKKRDEICKKGEAFYSPALNFTVMQLTQKLEIVKQMKIAQSFPTENDDDGTPILVGDSMIINDKLYSPGDFVLYASNEMNVPGIMCLEKLWINNENIPMMSGNLFLRPIETQHSPIRRFIDKEVFKSDKHATMPLNKLQGKCYVMCIKDYPKLRPDGFLERDLYVCESRYNSLKNTFRKIRSWNHLTNKIKLVERETPLEIKRLTIKKVQRTPDEVRDIEAMLPLKRKSISNIPVVIHGVEEGRTYYDQYNLSSGLVLKTGDFVYTESIEVHNPSIVHVCAIYEARDGNSYIRGPYLKLPKDLPNLTSKMVYPQEIFLSTFTETTPTSSILGKCSVLETMDYTTRRLTEIYEKDVYICESVFDEIKGQIRKLSKPGELKKIVNDPGVTKDEIYFFKKPITPLKISYSEYNNLESSRQYIPTGGDDDIKDDVSDFLDINEDSMDIESMLPEAVVSSSPATIRTPLGSPAASNHTTEKSISRRSKTVTGFILFQSQYRRQRHEEHPGSSFGEVSRMLGEEWKNMGPAKRAIWKEKAINANKEARAQFRVDNPELFLNETHSTSTSRGDISSREQTGSQLFNNNRENPIANQVFDCGWDDCDFEFEDPGDLLEHSLATKDSCVQRNIKRDENGKRRFECMWRTCNRIRRGLEPFPDWPRLLRHVREVHVYRHPGRIVDPENRGMNYIQRKNPLPSRSQSPMHDNSRSETPINTVPSPSCSPATVLQIETNIPATSTAPIAEKVSNPLFITVPPRPQRVLHSEAYIKYIESLQPKINHKPLYQKTLRATQDNTAAVDISKLPTQWLGKRAQEKPDQVVNALWNLRHYMMKDLLALHKIK
ncbi:protein polybromo-1-like isoform X2 [Culicoides brevitarsis]|uniref:protein polybromo-1-like isoform X2 n=1 Tax=Culicoides brevitarsis TaxID=469753 RepID=UPI00307BE455